MRLIDADALKELFSEVIGHIAKKPEMNGNLEHMVRASAMVIQMIDDAPTVQPDTTTHDSNVVKKGGNDEDRTTDDYISRQQAIDALKEKVFHNLSDEFYGAMQVLDELPFAQPETAKRIVGKSRDGMTLWYQCDTCNEPVDAQDNYCRGCGRRLIDETD